MDDWQPPYKSRQWQRLSKYVLNQEPFCRYCKELGKLTPSEVVDHIVPAKKRPDLFFVVDNLQGLCKRCHDSVKAREEMKGHRIGCNADGSPVDGGHWWND